MYIATIINCPWARLMIPMTPMMSVMPIPIRAYSPPLRTPATRVWRKTSMETPGSAEGPISGEAGRRSHRRPTSRSFHASLPVGLLPLPPLGNGENVLLLGRFLGPDGFQLPLLPLDHEGGELVLLGLLVVGDELHRAEGGHHVGRGQGIADVLRGDALRPLECVRHDVQGSVRLGAVILGVFLVLRLVLLEIVHGSGVGDGFHPQGRRVHQFGRVAGVLMELGERKSGPAADEELGIEVQFLRLAHQERRVHDVGDHVDQVGIRRLDLREHRLEVDGPLVVPLLEKNLDPELLAILLELLRAGLPEEGILEEDDGRLRLDHLLEEGDDRRRVLAGGGVDPEDVVVAALRDLVRRAGRDQEGNLELLGDGGRGGGDGTGVPPGDDGHLLLGDQLLRGGPAYVGLPGVVLEKQYELVPFDSALRVDLLGGHLEGTLLDLAELRLLAGQRQHDADLDVFGHRDGASQAQRQGNRETDNQYPLWYIHRASSFSFWSDFAGSTAPNSRESDSNTVPRRYSTAIYSGKTDLRPFGPIFPMEGLPRTVGFPQAAPMPCRIPVAVPARRRVRRYGHLFSVHLSARTPLP